MARQLSPAYRTRRPTETVLYRVLDEHLGRFIDEVEAADRPLPMFVRRELEGFLSCGRLEFGFVRQFCAACSFERLIGLPCAGRGFCPSCLGRRMVEGAARLVDQILPDVPVRQWVLSLPPPLRFALAYDNPLCSTVLSLSIREIFRWLKWTAKRELGLSSVEQAECGSVTAIHRVGSYANLNTHFHAGVLDGVWVSWSEHDELTFHALPAPTRADLTDISRRVYRRTRALFISLGRDWEQPEQMDEQVADLQEPLLLDCAQASLRGVGLLGEQAGQLLLPHEDFACLAIPPDMKDREQTGGFDLQATRRVSRGDRAGLERMCRYILHPPLSHDRLQLTDAGRVRLRFSRPWRNGVDAMELEPLNFIARLVPFVPAPGTHQLRYHGVLAARSKLRAKIVAPRQPDGSQQLLFSATGKPTRAARHDAPTSTSSRLPKLQRMNWARLLKRMADYDMDTCPECGAQLRMLSAVLDPAKVHRDLAARGLLDPIPELARSPSRGPPTQLVLDLESHRAQQVA